MLGLLVGKAAGTKELMPHIVEGRYPPQQTGTARAPVAPCHCPGLFPKDSCWGMGRGPQFTMLRAIPALGTRTLGTVFAMPRGHVYDATQESWQFYVRKSPSHGLELPPFL